MKFDSYDTQLFEKANSTTKKKNILLTFKSLKFEFLRIIVLLSFNDPLVCQTFKYIYNKLLSYAFKWTS